MAETVGTAYVRLHVLGTGLDREIRREIRKATPEVVEGGEDHGDAYGHAFGESFTKRFRHDLDDAFSERNTRRSTRRFSDTLGRLFGRGSRNDFLNFVGSFVRGTARMGESLGDLPSTITDLTGKFRTFMSLLGKGGRGAGAAGAAAGAAARGGGILLGIAVLTESFGLLGSTLSGLTAIITAVASTLTFALAGALTAAGGAAIFLAAGIGGVALAFANLTDAQKKALAPIGREFGRLGDIAAQSFGPALVRNVDGITAALERLEPVVKVVSGAMGHVLDGLVESLNGPAWQRFLRTFQHAAPGIIENLGDAFTNFGEIFAGVFRAAIPLVQTFAGWLAGAAEQVSDWVNSVAGQNRLQQFFADAGDAAAVVGDVLGELTEALFTVFDAGNKSGQNILGGLADALDRFNEWAKSKEGQRALQDWFEFAEDLAGELGDVFEAVIDFLDRLDTEDHRKELLTTLDILETMIRLTGKLFTALDKITHFFTLPALPVTWLDDIYKKAKEFAARIGKAFGNINWGKVFDLPSWQKILFGTDDPIGRIKNRFSGLAKRIVGWIGDVDWSKVFGSPWPRVNSLVSGLAKRIATAMGDVNWAEIFKDPWTYVRSKVAGLAKKIGDAIGNVNWGDVFSDPWTWVRDKVSGLGDKIANAIGSIDLSVNIDWPDPPSWIGRLDPRRITNAAGGVFDKPSLGIIGEAGPEAVVPLSRPLSQVDPAVRELSAIAQGLRPRTLVAVGSDGKPNQTNNFFVTTPTKDPAAVAREVMNRLVVVGY